MAELNIPSTFYLVTGWVDGTEEIADQFNRDLDHGTWKDWIELKSQGLDLGCHSHCHKKNIDSYEDSIKCKNIFSEYFSGPYNFSFPYCIKNEVCEFDSYKMGYVKKTNKLGNDLKYLSSYNPEFDNPKLNLKEIPDNSWLIITLHGIDEGWMPINIEKILKIEEECIENNIFIKTISQVINWKNLYLL